MKGKKALPGHWQGEFRRCIWHERAGGGEEGLSEEEDSVPGHDVGKWITVVSLDG